MTDLSLLWLFAFAGMAGALLVRQRGSVFSILTAAGIGLCVAGVVLQPWLVAGWPAASRLPQGVARVAALVLPHGLWLSGLALVVIAIVCFLSPLRVPRTLGGMRRLRTRTFPDHGLHLIAIGAGFVAFQVFFGVLAALLFPVTSGGVLILANLAAVALLTFGILRLDAAAFRELWAVPVPAGGILAASCLLTLGLQILNHVFHRVYLAKVLSGIEFLSRHGVRPQETPSLLLAAMLLIAPFAEEFFFRGCVIPRMARRRSGYHAVVGSALLFAACHFNLVQFFHTLVIGCFWGWLFLRTGSLWLCVANHFVFNAAALLLGRPWELFYRAWWSARVPAGQDGAWLCLVVVMGLAGIALGAVHLWRVMSGARACASRGTDVRPARSRGAWQGEKGWSTDGN
jgi:membrane protease YdiL (CAAX protease family)